MNDHTAKQVAKELIQDGQGHRFFANAIGQIAEHIEGAEMDMETVKIEDTDTAMDYIAWCYKTSLESYSRDKELDEEESLNSLNDFVENDHRILLDRDGDWCVLSYIEGDVVIITIEGDTFERCFRDLKEARRTGQID